MACFVPGSVNCRATCRACSARSRHSKASLKTDMVWFLPSLGLSKAFFLFDLESVGFPPSITRQDGASRSRKPPLGINPLGHTAARGQRCAGTGRTIWLGTSPIFSGAINLLERNRGPWRSVEAKRAITWHPLSSDRPPQKLRRPPATGASSVSRLRNEHFSISGSNEVAAGRSSASRR
jgi:hypothetical protein